MGFDHRAWLPGHSPATEPEAVEPLLDWHGLRARFLAARACQRQLNTPLQASERAANACFDRSAAQAMAEFAEASHDVNLTDSVDGKGPRGMEDGVADASERGDRG